MVHVMVITNPDQHHPVARRATPPHLRRGAVKNSPPDSGGVARRATGWLPTVRRSSSKAGRLAWYSNSAVLPWLPPASKLGKPRLNAKVAFCRGVNRDRPLREIKPANRSAGSSHESFQWVNFADHENRRARHRREILSEPVWPQISHQFRFPWRRYGRRLSGLSA